MTSRPTHQVYDCGHDCDATDKTCVSRKTAALPVEAPRFDWQIRALDQSLICQWLQDCKASTASTPARFHCPRHHNNPTGVPNEFDCLSGFRKNLAWLLLGAGVDHLLDDEPLDVVEAVGDITEKTSATVEFYVGRRINRAVAPWIDHPLEFRGVLRKTRSVVSGSLALRVVTAGQWRCNNMDVYVPAGTSRERVLEYLQAKESYAVVETIDVSQVPVGVVRPFTRFVETVTVLEKTVSTAQGDIVRRIQVHKSKAGATKPVASFSATWSMNWIGADEIVVCYPSLTLAGEGVLNSPCQLDTEEVAIWLSKYIDRDFRLVDVPSRLDSRTECYVTCGMRRRLDRGGDALRLLASTYKDGESPEGPWIFGGWRGLSKFEYCCLEHGGRGVGTCYAAIYDNFSLYMGWDELD